MEIAKGLVETLKIICRCFADADITFCLVGGLAVGMLSKPRATEDIDLLVLIGEEDIRRIMEMLGERLSIVKMPEIMHFKKASIQRILFKDTVSAADGFVILDILFADNDVYKDALKDLTFVTIDDTPIPVPTRKNLLNIKRLSGRPQDILDIEALMVEE
ncbi:MAG: hypothetical protein WCQ99_16420 [Pseudomonadota bacterium]